MAGSIGGGGGGKVFDGLFSVTKIGLCGLDGAASGAERAPNQGPL
jgi:hypothetical protein